MTRHRLLIIAIATATVLVGACDRNGAAGADEAAAPVEPGPTAEASGTPRAERTAGADDSGPAEAAGAELNTGATCSDDRGCKLYLRCIEASCQVPPAMTGEATPTTPVATFETADGDQVRFFLEMAVEPHEMSRGLMFRRTMEDDWGMLFVYPSEGTRSFWMKNTLIPLDMVFIDAKGRVVNVIEAAEPLTLNPRRSTGPARYVLELNAGRAAEVGITAGSTMALEHVSPPHQVR